MKVIRDQVVRLVLFQKLVSENQGGTIYGRDDNCLPWRDLAFSKLRRGKQVRS